MIELLMAYYVLPLVMLAAGAVVVPLAAYGAYRLASGRRPRVRLLPHGELRQSPPDPPRLRSGR